MHLISKIQIQNFRSIKDACFTLAGYTPLVGYNNAGKTNILKAVQWAVRKTSLSESDFFNKSEAVIVTATISGVTSEVLDGVEEKHRNRIQDYILNEIIKIRRSQNTPNVKVGDIKLEVLKGDGSWADNPTGIDAAISALFPEPIFIGAMENSLDDLSKNTANSAIGSLIKEITDDISARYSPDVETALSTVEQKLSSDSSVRDEDLVGIDNQIQSEVDKFFTGISAKIHIPVLKFTDFLKGGTIKLQDTSLENTASQDASTFGHGTQRTIQIALIKCLADIKRNRADGNPARTTLLLIDEPELYLHPQAIELVRQSLSALSGEGYQVIFTTHSPCMITRNDAVKTQIIRRIGGKTSALTSIENAAEQMSDADAQSEMLFEMGNASQILFSEQVLLFEGKTEKAVLPDLFQTVNGNSLAAEKIGTVSMNSVDNIPKGLKVLKAMGISCKAIVDLDFAFRGAVTANLIDANHEAIEGCKKILTQLADDGQLQLGDSGLPTRKIDPETSKTISIAAQGFALMAEQDGADTHIAQLHDALLAHGIWLWQKGAIETHLELPDKSSKAHTNFVKDLHDNRFEKLNDFENIKALCDWITNIQNDTS